MYQGRLKMASAAFKSERLSSARLRYAKLRDSDAACLVWEQIENTLLYSSTFLDISCLFEVRDLRNTFSLF